ncbi:MAG: 50S ribosomal protein L5 [Candidatus Micrarchaeota archaeon]|nr:50S ribosomal protein L5 [Candidatus Micrarchaeota archaeon]
MVNGSSKKQNKMRDIEIEKVTINLGLGSSGEKMDNIKEYCENLFGRKFVKTLARTRNPTFKIKKGEPIGLKCTFRKKEAEKVLRDSLSAVRNKLKKKNFDRFGNLSFGVKEYIDYPNAKYDSTIGLFGFDVCVTFKRKGYRVVKRKIGFSKIGKSHRITKDECMEFMKTKYKVEIV